MTKINSFLSVIFCVVFCFYANSSYAQDPSCQAGKSSQAAAVYFNAENQRSDTFDVLKYEINLEIGNTSNQQITGNTRIRIAPKMNNRTFIRFDLLRLFVDSVKENNTLLTFMYNDTVLRVNFLAPKNITDTSWLTVYYRGTPQIDATGWGGFYFNNTQSAQYAYNLGVGFGANPHNYGRVWFPCFDNFVERSKYEFNITSDTVREAYCNGVLVSDAVNGLKRTRRWVLNEEIPTYLVSVSLANYTQVNWSINALNGVKPITLVANAADTSGMKVGFANLKSCITGFENYFGPYRWNRVGYCLVPFNSGAMEHATNITYPRSAANSLAFEDLMAHELSHHWWGNLVTCETPEDMWINEGMASFSAYMFFEWHYGKQNALNRIKSRHDELLHFLHKDENGFRAVSGVPHSLTYSDHVYRKGADIAHTLRGYMGDSAFFKGCKYVMQQKAFQSMNSDEFRDLLQISSGQSLVNYFNDWVFTGGWSHFDMDSVSYKQLAPGSVNAAFSLKQKLYGRSVLHTNVPLELSFFDANWTRVDRTVVMSGAIQNFTVNLPFTPVYAALNYNTKINDATSHEYKVIKSTGTVSYPLGKIILQVQDKGADSSLLRIVHHYVRPDGFKNFTTHKLSDQHYWSVEGIITPGFVSKAQFNYNGFKGTSGTYIYMDTLLANVNGDSIALFFRKNAGDEWKWLRSAVKTVVNAKSGFITVDTLQLGEYAFGNLGDTASVGILMNQKTVKALRIFPNPARKNCTIEFSNQPFGVYEVQLLSMDGKVALKQEISDIKTQLDFGGLAKGSYTISVIQEKEGFSCSQKLIIE